MKVFSLGYIFVSNIKDVSKLGSTGVITTIYIILFTTIYLIAGLYMWRGWKLGWWLGALAFLYGLVETVIMLLLILRVHGIFSGQFAAHYQEYNLLYFTYVVLILVYLLIFAWFFKRNILEYFGLQGQGKIRAITALLIATIILFIGENSPDLMKFL
jgi:hypothetical protein